MKKTETLPRRELFDFDMDNLLHPAQVFDHPRHVVSDPDLALNEKRAILAFWASDACAYEATPGLRQAPGTSQPARFDDVIDALREANEPYRAPPGSRRVMDNRVSGLFGCKSNNSGTPGHGQPLT
jgi:hypothetical protein